MFLTDLRSLYLRWCNPPLAFFFLPPPRVVEEQSQAARARATPASTAGMGLADAETLSTHTPARKSPRVSTIDPRAKKIEGC